MKEVYCHKDSGITVYQGADGRIMIAEFIGNERSRGRIYNALELFSIADQVLREQEASETFGYRLLSMEEELRSLKARMTVVESNQDIYRKHACKKPRFGWKK